MIYNRTQQDIDAAVLIRKKLQGGENLTDSDIEKLQRGCLTIETLNRIEQKQTELKGLLNSLGYWNTEGLLSDFWSYEKIFKQEDFDRILRNLSLLRESFYVYSNTPMVPDSNFTKFETINAVEHILNDMESMVNEIKSNFRFCGVSECKNE